VNAAGKVGMTQIASVSSQAVHCCCCLTVNAAGRMWCCSSGETFLHCDLHGCSDVTAVDDLAGVCACNAAGRRRGCGGPDHAADTAAQVTYGLNTCS